MSFNAPPPPPPDFPGMVSDQKPRKNKTVGILVAALIVLVLAAVVVGAWWFMNHEKSQPSAATSTQSAHSSEKPSQKTGPTVAPSHSPSPTKIVKADATAGNWKSTPSGTPTQQSEESSALPSDDTATISSAKQDEFSLEYCDSGRILVFAETAKHYAAICEDGNQLFYRGVGKKSGNPITLEATDLGGGRYKAINESSTSTTYELDEDRLTVSTSTEGTILDSSVIRYETFG